MNRRALFKSVVAAVCIGTAQQLGVKVLQTKERFFRGFYHVIDHLPEPRWNYTKTNPDYTSA